MVKIFINYLVPNKIVLNRSISHYPYLLTLALFASILCFSSSITVFNPFLFTPYLSFSSFSLRFFFNLSSPSHYFSRKLTSYLSLFISPSVLRFHLGSFLSLCSAFFNPICSAIHTVAALFKLFISVMLLLFKYLIASLSLSV